MEDYELVMKVKKLHPEAKIQEKANPSDLGWDLFSVEDVIVHATDRVLVKTGIAIQFPDLVDGLLLC